MQPIVFNMGVEKLLLRDVSIELGAECGIFEQRHFPDGETYLRINTASEGRPAIVMCNLDRPDHKILPLLFMAQTLRDLGATQVGLIAPYLPYMRQDRVFHFGEGISARYFAKIVSAHFDWISTVDPHLHRIHSLDEIFTIPTRVVKSASIIANWIRANVSNALLIGPDQESEQWVSSIAERADSPYVILEKVRSGDRQVRISLPDLQAHRDKVPVLIDDIVSSGHTLVETIKQLDSAGMSSPLAVVIHGIFAETAMEAINQAGIRELVTCNTISHDSNRIDVSKVLGQASKELVEQVQASN